MPMVLRSRRSNRVELEPTPRRRTTRPLLNRHYEEPDESEPEANTSPVMERREAELEQEAAEETGRLELKGCRVVLDPLHIDERTQRKETEEKEDMNRKGGKPVSRIPTYQKRPGSGSLVSERSGRGSPAAERLSSGSPAAERPGSGSLVSERPGRGSPGAERLGSGSPAAERPGSGSQVSERPGRGSPATERPGRGSPATERQGSGSPAAERQGSGSPAAERLGSGSPAAERPGSGSQISERPGRGSQVSERPGRGSPATERQGSGSPAAERLGSGSPVTERPGSGSQVSERPGRGSPAVERPDSGSQATERPGSGSQAAYPPSPRKVAPVHVVQPSVKDRNASVETLKSKHPEVGEFVLPPPSVRVPSFITASFSSSVEHAASADHTSAIAAPQTRNIPEPAQGVMITSPRPPLRPEQDMNKRSKAKVGSTPEGLLSSLLQESVLILKPEEKRSGMTLSACGDTEKSEETADITVVKQTECIIEEPPWEPVKATESQSSRSSSDADLATERSEDNNSEDVEEHQEPLENQTKLPDPEVEEPCMDDSAFYVEPKKAPSEKTTQSTKRSMCSAVSLFLLLLVGGLGLHVWLYGLPTSAAQLVAQLELHRLEGIGLVPENCSSDCRVQLVESIPVGLYPYSSSPGPSIADSWLRLLDKAKSSVHIAAFYFTLRDNDVQSDHPSDFQGRKVFEQLKKLESRGVKLQVAVNAPQTSKQDTAELSAAGAQVREVNLSAVTGGIVHTKLWVVDQKHFYLGSANMDWRSLSQVKEVGLSVEDCSCLAQDASRIFGVYWAVGGSQNGSLPLFWPARLSALSSAGKPLDLNFNGVPAQVYLSSAPPPISARGRSDDLSAILSVIDDARRFIHISVMDYLPLSQYTEPLQFWPAIDSRLRAAACTRGVQVRLLVSCWEHSPASMFIFLQSLLVLSRPPLQCSIDVKMFTVPSTEEQMKIPFARVNHAKYMVTDRVLYIGTSNWSQNYFRHTAGVGLVVNQTGSAGKQGQQTLQGQAERLFLRDWDSPYASQLRVDDLDVCPQRRGFAHW